MNTIGIGSDINIDGKYFNMGLGNTVTIKGTESGINLALSPYDSKVTGSQNIAIGSFTTLGIFDSQKNPQPVKQPLNTILIGFQASSESSILLYKGGRQNQNITL